MANVTFDDLIPSQNAPQPMGYVHGDGTPVQAAAPITPQSAAPSAPKVSFDDLIPTKADGEKGVPGTVDAIGRGIVNAATFGFGDEIGAAADALGSHLPWRDPKTYDQALADTRAGDSVVAAEHPIANIAGNVAGAVGVGGALAGNGLSLAGRAIGAGRSLTTTAAASAIDGGVAGGLTGFGQGEGGLDNRLAGAKSGAIDGATIGTVLPIGVAGATNAVRRAVTPFTSSPVRQGLVDTLANEGVDVTAGQAVGSKNLRNAESEIGGQTAQNIAERQKEQFTAAALRRVGINDANRATPDVVDRAFTQNSNQFNAATGANTLVPDTQLHNDFVTNWREYMQLVNPTQRAPIVGNTMWDINDALVNGGTLDGATYQALRSRLSAAARRSRADPQLADALNGMSHALDDAMERSIAANNPADLGAFRQARNTYRNLLVVEKASTAAGEDAANGLISPSALRTAVKTTHGMRNLARGNGDFADLARAGEGVMKPLPDSGTAGRMRAQNLGATVTGGVGAAIGAVSGGPLGATAGAIGGAAIPHIVGRMMMSQGGQAYLRNQLMSGAINPQTRAGIISAINQIDANFLPSMENQH